MINAYAFPSVFCTRSCTLSTASNIKNSHTEGGQHLGAERTYTCYLKRPTGDAFQVQEA